MRSNSTDVSCYSDAFANGGRQFSRLLRETDIIKRTVMSFVCFVWPVGFVEPKMFLSSWFCALLYEGCLRANEGVLISQLRKMKANILERGLPTMIGDCEVDPVLVLLAYARLNEIDRSDSEALGWCLYDFATAIIFAVLEWKANGSKRDRHVTAFSGAVHPKVVLRYAEEF